MALTTTTKLLITRCAPRNFRRISKTRQITAGVIVIGDEILNGDISDTNSTVITKDLHNLGVQVKKVSIIGDEIDEICDEVKIFSQRYSHVITSGGIGPTHDDVTFEAVARAFGENLVLNGELRKICERFYSTSDVNHPGMKLAMVPESSKLIYGDNSKYPNVSVKNVYMFPGIPELFVKSFHNLAPKLFKSDTIFYKKRVYLNVTEDKISSQLSELAGSFPNVQFGSYPKLFHESYKVKVTIASTSEGAVEEACNQLLENLPKDSIVALV